MDIITPKRIRITLKTVRAFIFISILFFLLFSFMAGSFILYAKIQGPPSLSVPQTTIFYADNGTKIGESHNGEKRYWVQLKDISPNVVNATLAIEDRNFYNHSGFDYKRIAGAAIADIKALAKVQGASTITQQYARNLFLEHHKTWKRKALEALYTVRIELNYEKGEILEGYLNTIYYGHGVYGIEAAANYYFGKKAEELTVAEAALLAGIPKGPSVYSPYIDEEKSLTRKNVVLQTMKEAKFITKEQHEKALIEDITFRTRKGNAQNRIAPYFHDAVMKEAANKLNIDEQQIRTSGLKIHTTLNQNMQEIAEEVITKSIDTNSLIQTGFIAMDPNTGEVKALVGGRNYEESPFNRVTQAKRQPGSTMKPILYYAAVNTGFTPSTVMRSEPTTFQYDDGQSTYKPSNYNDYYANDLITLLEAMALSDNVYAVKTHLYLGMDELIKTAKQLGINTKLNKVPSLALGTSPVRLIDLVNAYGIIGNGGKRIEPVFIKKVEDSNGNVLYEEKKDQEQILDEDAAFVTTHMMTGMFDKRLNSYTSVTGQGIANMLTRDYAGKSGTTETDSWMVGLTPQLVAGVWTGYDKGKSINIVEEKGYSKLIWAKFMEEALKNKAVKKFKPSNGVIGVYINPESGKIATEDCPTERLTYYIAGTEPVQYCTAHIGEQKDDKQENSQGDTKKTWYEKIFKWN
ncbi:transglycosylase domain-containing protein [Metabacillus fastidiosus]|uniref:transglycosylase domain-containing protein n=1 Tax=Metabacillus fastidiosus TaxID=1458 RepID=UPI003D26AD4F